MVWSTAYGYEGAGSKRAQVMELLLGNLNYSSWSIRALLVARVSGAAIKETVLPLLADGTRETVRQQARYHKVPALIDGDVVVRDSLAITEYLAEMCDPGVIWPIDRRDRALARTVVAEMHSSFPALRSQCPVDIRSRHTDIELTDATKADIQRILEIWQECRTYRSTDGPYLLGKWSAADAFYAPVVTRFKTYGVELDGADKVYSEAILGSKDMRSISQAAEAEPWLLTATPNGQVYGGLRP